MRIGLMTKYLVDKVVPSPLTIDVDSKNVKLDDILSGQVHEYTSINTIEEQERDDNAVYSLFPRSRSRGWPRTSVA